MPGELLIHYGNPGSGKTLFAMKDIVLPACKEHRPFFTNITGISVSALSYLSGVHQAFIKYYPVENISDVIRYFDDEKISHDGVFILDEMKDFIDDEKAVKWLESRLNVMRKHSVDFIFIAQQCKKEYIHPNLVGLANACNVYRTRKRENDPNRVQKFYVNGGVPKIMDNTVANAVGEEILQKPVEMYNAYETSESAFYSGAENNTYFGLKWYQERKWKFRFVIIGFVALMFIVAAWLVWGIFDFGGTDLGALGNVSTKVGNNEIQEQTKVPAQVPQDSIPCFAYLVCDSFDCRTDKGIFPLSAYNADSGVLCGDGRCMRKCERNIDISDGGRLLPIGKQVLAK